MNLEKVVFGFFVLLALTLNFGFVLGDLDNPEHHHSYELYGAIVVSLIATVLKFGDRSHMGATLLATSLVADLQLLLAALTMRESFLNGNTMVVATPLRALAHSAACIDSSGT